MKIGRMNNRDQYDLLDKLKLEHSPPEMQFQKGEEIERFFGHHMSDRQIVNEVQMRAGEYPLRVSQQEIDNYKSTMKLLYIYVSGGE